MTRPEATLRGILARIPTTRARGAAEDVEAQVATMLNFQTQEYRMRTSSVDQVRKQLSARSVGRWKAYRQFADPGGLFDVADPGAGWPGGGA